MIERGLIKIDMYYMDDTQVELELTVEPETEGESETPFDLSIFENIVMDWKRKRLFFADHEERWELGDGFEVTGESNNILRIELNRQRVKNIRPGHKFFGDIRFIAGNQVSTYLDVEVDITHSVTQVYNG